MLLIQRGQTIVDGGAIEAYSKELVDVGPWHDSGTIHERSVSESKGCTTERSFASGLLLV